MKRLAFFIVGSAALVCAAAEARIIHVPADYPTIQSGINAGAGGDTILVQPGVYFERLVIDSLNITLGSLYLLDGDTGHVSSTVIDGGSVGTAVTFRDDVDRTAAITGFTIRRGGSSYDGGGIRLYDSSPVIRGNRIVDCSAGRYGGGIYCESSSPLIVGNLISRCYSHY